MAIFGHFGSPFPPPRDGCKSQQKMFQKLFYFLKLFIEKSLVRPQKLAKNFENFVWKFCLKTFLKTFLKNFLKIFFENFWIKFWKIFAPKKFFHKKTLLLAKENAGEVLEPKALNWARYGLSKPWKTPYMALFRT